jgi:hypothetical protein
MKWELGICILLIPVLKKIVFGEFRGIYSTGILILLEIYNNCSLGEELHICPRKVL